MSRQPIVSVVVPTYNRADLLVETLDSILNQTYIELYEVIIVDDGSTDSTPEVLTRYGDRIRIIRQENRGVTVARNRGISEARGEYVALCDSDDLWPPDKLERQMKIAVEHPEAEMLYGDFLCFEDATGETATSSTQTPSTPSNSSEPLSKSPLSVSSDPLVSSIPVVPSDRSVRSDRSIPSIASIPSDRSDRSIQSIRSVSSDRSVRSIPFVPSDPSPPSSSPPSSSSSSSHPGRRFWTISEDRPSGYVFPKLLEHNFIVPSTLIFRRRAVETVGLFDPEDTHAEDYDFSLRMAARFEVVYCPFVCCHYRIHPRTKTHERELYWKGFIRTLIKTRGLIEALHRKGELCNPIDHRPVSEEEIRRWNRLLRKRIASFHVRLAHFQSRKGRGEEAWSQTVQAFHLAPFTSQVWGVMWKVLRHRLGLRGSR